MPISALLVIALVLAACGRPAAPLPSAETSAPTATSVPWGDLLGDMILIPAGEFTMGEGYEAHPVYLDTFYIGKYEVTNAQYKRFVEATGHRVPQHWSGGSIPKGKQDHPVVNVSWHDARSYCQWLADETGQVVRLPTEAQWEKAARGTDGREYPWGNEFDKDRCNWFEAFIGDTTAVGKYSPQGDSPYGVADMAGNVWEWTSSLYKAYPYDASDGRDDPEAEGWRLLRGGSFKDGWGFARVTSRGIDLHPTGLGVAYGCRIVLLPPGSP